MSVFKECLADTTLAPENFTIGEKNASKPHTYPHNNAGFLSVQRQIETVMQIVLSKEYEKAVESLERGILLVYIHTQIIQPVGPRSPELI